MLEDELMGIGDTVAWEENSVAILYVRFGSATHPPAVLRHVIGSHPGKDEVLLLGEQGASLHVAVSKTHQYVDTS